jgi:hypothetical protein
MSGIRYIDGTVSTRKSPVHCTVVTVYGYGGQPYRCIGRILHLDQLKIKNYHFDPPSEVILQYCNVTECSLAIFSPQGAILRPTEDEQLDDREVEIDSDNKFVS